MSKYSADFKKSLVLKTLQPSGPSLIELSKKHGIPATTVYGWKRKYASTESMSDSKFTPERKLEILNILYGLEDEKRGAFLREEGLHTSDIEQWKKEYFASQKRSVGRPKKDPEVRELEKEKSQLLKDLNRKNKALAEMSARVVLLKKSHEIWGVDEEEE